MATTTGPPYNLSIPQDGDVADVPQDFLDLANGVITALNGKLPVDAALPGFTASDYQRKILVITSGTALPTTPYPNQIVFVVS